MAFRNLDRVNFDYRDPIGYYESMGDSPSERRNKFQQHQDYDKDVRSALDMYTNVLQSEMLGLPRTPSPVDKRCIDSVDRQIYSLSPLKIESQSLLFPPPKKQRRHIQKQPFKVLDAPDIGDDFYLHLLDWSNENMIAVGLGLEVYLWSAANSRITKLSDSTSRTVKHYLDETTCVSWHPDSNLLAVGAEQTKISLWDVEYKKVVQMFNYHTARVGVVSWNRNIMTSGSRDRTIVHHDIRTPTNVIQTLKSHVQEVCGLTWSPDGTKLASGGNDNKMYIWSGMDEKPLYKFEHRAAIKALAWSPHQSGVIASGAGTADQCIRFWNVHNGTCSNTVKGGSQVCNVAWSKTNNEFISTHGFSHNEINVWEYPSMEKVATLTAHTYRVLYLAMSPDGTTIVTAAGDETLRFWKVFPEKKKKNQGTTKSDRIQFDIR